MLDRIMTQIKFGLTGDNAKDICYLIGKVEEYKGHRLFPAIKAACGDMIVNLMMDYSDECVSNGLAGNDNVEAVNAPFQLDIYLNPSDADGGEKQVKHSRDVEEFFSEDDDDEEQSVDLLDVEKFLHDGADDVDNGEEFFEGPLDVNDLLNYPDDADNGEEFFEGPLDVNDLLNYPDDADNGEELFEVPLDVNDLLNYPDDDLPADKASEDGDISNIHVPGNTLYGSLEDALEDLRKHVVNLMNEANFEEASEVYRKLIEQLEERGMVQEDNDNIYISFNEWFEDILYDFYFKPKKQTASAPANYSKIYREYASMLFKSGRYEDAEIALEKAMIWNPVDCDLRFDHASVLKVQEEWEAFFEYSCMALKFAFKPEQVAQGYRNIGSYLMEKEKFVEAAMCYLMSVSYDKSKVAYSKLAYLEENYGIDVKNLSPEKEIEITEEYGFKGLVDEDVLGLMFATGKKYYEDGNYPPAIYLFDLFYNLTGNENVKETLDFMKKTMAK